MGQAYIDSLDIANKGCQLLGVTQIASPTEVSKNNREMSFVYDKLRAAELQRNNWVFAVRKAALRPIDTTTMLLKPAAYSGTTTYLYGALVADPNGLVWISQISDNLNNLPGGNNDTWEAYFGPQTANPYDSTLAYFSGEMVYMAGSYPGSFQVFMSLINGNTDVPNVATTYSSTVTYHAGSVVLYLGSHYKSTAELNLGITPFNGALILPFDISSTYASGNQVTGSDNQIYTSATNGNLGHDPTTDAGAHWTATGTTNAWALLPVGTVVSSTNWLPVACQIKSLNILYPIGSGPSSQATTRNAYHIPAGFLRTAPQDPKAGSTSYLGAPSGNRYSQWNPEGNYIIANGVNPDPIILRFIANITRVIDMNDMFCGGLACSCAIETCEILTQSTAKLQNVQVEYKRVMGEARTVNAIEAGPLEPPEDDYVTCRL